MHDVYARNIRITKLKVPLLANSTLLLCKSASVKKFKSWTPSLHAVNLITISGKSKNKIK